MKQVKYFIYRALSLLVFVQISFGSYAENYNDKVKIELKVDTATAKLNNLLTFYSTNFNDNAISGKFKLDIYYNNLNIIYSATSYPIALNGKQQFNQHIFSDISINNELYSSILSHYNGSLLPGNYSIVLSFYNHKRTYVKERYKFNIKNVISLSDKDSFIDVNILNNNVVPDSITYILEKKQMIHNHLTGISYLKIKRDTFLPGDIILLPKENESPKKKFNSFKIHALNNKVKLFTISSKQSLLILPDTLKIKDTIPKKNLGIEKRDLISTSGSIVSDNHTSTFRHPYQTTPASYSRLYITPSINVVGLPINLNIFLTTENNTRYSMNNISFNFDSDRYKRNIENSYKQKWGIQQQEFERNKNQLNFDKNQLQLTEYSLNKKLELEGIDIPSDSIDTDQYTTLLIAKINDLYNKKVDSLSSLEYQPNINDSISINSNEFVTKKENIRKQKENIEDKRAQMISLIKTVEKRKNEIRQLESIIELQSLNQGVNPFISTKDSLYNQFNSDTNISNIQRLMMSVKSFDVGITYPFYSRYTVNGLATKGLDAEFSFNKFSFKTTMGKGMRDDYTTIGFETKPTFDRNVFSLGASYKLHDNLTINSSIHKIKDTQLNNPEFFPKDNFIYSIGTDATILKKVKWETEFSRSYYIDNFLNVFDESGKQFEYSNIYKSFKKSGIKPKNAFENSINYNLSDATQLSHTFKKVETGYKTLGSLFLRNDFIENEIGIKQLLFKRKVNVKGFYKNNRDNLLNQKPSTNILSGYGATVQTNFPKKPNIVLSYSPYQQGNNNADTLLRTNNKLSILTGTLTYFTTIKKVTSSSIITYVRSNNEFNNGNHALVNNILANEKLLVGKNWEINLAYNKSITSPKIDSVNYNAKIASICYKWPSKIHTELGTKRINYKSGAIIHESFVGVNFTLLKEFIITSRFSYGKIDGIWGYNNKEILTGDLNLTYFW